MAAAVHLTLIAPDNEKFTVQLAPARLPRRKPNVGGSISSSARSKGLSKP